jgi:HPt (histidine-containing phosphotransfer) domain-containing protein
MSTMTSLILNRDLIAEIRRIEQASGQHDLFVGCVRRLEDSVRGFRAAFESSLARGDSLSAARAAHSLKGSCRQLGAQALGDLFGDIEQWTKVGDYAEARRTFDGGADLIEDSIDALKRV